MRGTVPNARAGHGFAKHSGNLYVHGGANADISGTDCILHTNYHFDLLVSYTQISFWFADSFVLVSEFIQHF